jgi:hypothetical protein
MKLKLKSRFKKALFAFFKDEILNSVGYNKPIQTIQHVCNEMRMTEIRTEIILDESKYHQCGTSVNQIYEYSLNDAKRKLFEESMKFIQIDEKSVIDPLYYSTRAITLKLFVGTKT